MPSNGICCPPHTAYGVRYVNGQAYAYPTNLLPLGEYQICPWYDPSRCEKAEVNGDTSDGYHTFNELYEHRTALFAALCNARSSNAYKTRKHEDGTMFEGMFLASLRTPDGPVTYHCENRYWDWFRIVEQEYADPFDGHTPDDVVKRLQSVYVRRGGYDFVTAAKAVGMTVHRNQKDKGGNPYVEHLKAVAEPFQYASSDFYVNALKEATAWLHDAIEDGYMSGSELEKVIDNHLVVAAVLDLTHFPGQSYKDYIKRIAKNPIATDVKLADLQHNCDLTRIPCVTDRDDERVRKYKKAIRKLEKAKAEREGHK